MEGYSLSPWFPLYFASDDTHTLYIKMAQAIILFSH